MSVAPSWRVSIVFGCVFWLALGSARRVYGEEPVLARLTFWLAPEKMDAFSTMYSKELAPLLVQYGLNATTQTGRATVDSVFSRLLVVEDWEEGLAQWEKMQQASVWQELLQSLDARFGEGDRSRLRFHYSAYSVPLEAAREVPVGKEGTWHNFEEIYGIVNALLQDRQGRLWVTILGGGICRYDYKGWTNFTKEDGLASDNVMRLLEDRQGHIWAGTWQGLSRYDGEEWTSFRSADGERGNNVSVLFEDSRGHIWVGTGGRGLGRYDGEEWMHFTEKNGLPGSGISALVEDNQGRLWVGTFEGKIGRYDGEEWTVMSVGVGEVWTLFKDGQGHIWAGTEKNGVRRFDGDRWQRFTSEDGLSPNEVRLIVQDRQGHMWFATGRGISRYNGAQWTTFTSEDGLAANRAEALLEDQQGNMWVGTHSGLSRFKDGQWTTFRAADGMPHSSVGVLGQGQEGGLWVGTRGGLGRYDPTWTSFTLGGGFEPPRQVNGQLWFPTTDGRILRYNGRKWTALDLVGDSERVLVGTPVQDAQGRIWLGTGDGLMRIDKGRISAFTEADGLVSRSFLNSFLDRQGHLWFATLKWGNGWGMMHYDGSQWTTVNSEDGLVHNRVKWIMQDRQGHMWFATTEGISRYDGAQWTTFSSEDGLANNNTQSLLQDQKGRLWSATIGGAHFWDGAHWRLFPLKQNLLSKWSTSIYEDQRGHLWFGTWSGAYRYDGQVMQHIKHRDGLASLSVWGIFQDEEENYWFVGDEQITRFEPPAPKPPVVRIHSLIADRRYENPQKVVVPASASLVGFEYSALSFRTRPEAMVYRYRMRGYDEDWKNTSHRRVEYQDLPVGRYAFEIVAVDRDLVYSEKPAQVILEVFPQPLANPLRLVGVELDDVFASFYSTYSQRPLGWAEVANGSVDSLDAVLHLSIPELMRQPVEIALKLAPQSTKQVPLKLGLDPAVGQLETNRSVPVQLVLSFERDGEILSTQSMTAPELALYGRGALRWDEVGRAAAFITSGAPPVQAFARPLLVTFKNEIQSLGAPGENILQALVLFEGLKQHGLRYLNDANTSYTSVQADKNAVDHIQYPAETLQSKAGDCDDLTVLYSSLLENAGIATALVDYPGHIFLLFDSGVSLLEAYKLPLDTGRYFTLGQRLWIPVEITQIDLSFHQAWQTGSELLRPFSAFELRRRVIATAAAWKTYPASSTIVEAESVPPERVELEAAFKEQYVLLQGMINKHIEETYLDPLKLEPDNDGLRTQLLKLYLVLNRFDTAISTALEQLLDGQGDKAQTHNQLGIAYYLKGKVEQRQDDIRQAAVHFKEAMEDRPQDKDIQRNLAKAMEALGRGTSEQRPAAEPAVESGVKEGATPVDVEDFYWVE